jgi:hypothetical protein
VPGLEAVPAEKTGGPDVVASASELQNLVTSVIVVDTSTLVVGLIELEVVVISTYAGSKLSETAPEGGWAPGKVTYICPSDSAENAKFSPNPSLVSLKNHVYPLGCIAPGNCIRGNDPVLPFVPTLASPTRSCPSEVRTKIAARSSFWTR